jgi:hypothetical protein
MPPSAYRHTSHAYIHAHTHIHTHGPTRTQADKHSHAHTRAHARAHTHNVRAGARTHNAHTIGEKGKTGANATRESPQRLKGTMWYLRVPYGTEGRCGGMGAACVPLEHQASSSTSPLDLVPLAYPSTHHAPSANTSTRPYALFALIRSRAPRTTARTRCTARSKSASRPSRHVGHPPLRRRRIAAAASRERPFASAA